MWLIRYGQNLVASSGELVPVHPTSQSEEYVDQQRMGLYVGLAAILLTPVMLLSSAVLGACYYDSISHYYYSRYTGDWFVGTLIFIAVFLAAYNGRYRAEMIMAKVAAIGAVMIAFFPTSGTGCEGNDPISGRGFVTFGTTPENALAGDVTISNGQSFTETFMLFGAAEGSFFKVDMLHFGGAALVFGVLTMFCFFVFTIARPGERDEQGRLKPGKARRNGIYYGCGVVMAGAIGVIVLNATGVIFDKGDDLVGPWERGNWMLWMEFAVLLPFGVAWFTKGRLAFWGEDSGPARWFARHFMDDAILPAALRSPKEQGGTA